MNPILYGLQEAILEEYKHEKCLNDKEYSVLLSSCCLQSNVKDIMRNNSNKNEIFLDLDKMFEPILKYINVGNLLSEDIDLSLLSFDIFEEVPLTEENQFELSEEGLSFPMLILELERIEKEDDYGLDDQKIFISVSKKNEWRNYIPIHNQRWLDLHEFFELYSLAEFFTVTHSLKLESELYLAEKEYLKNEIIKTTAKLKDLNDRLEEIELNGNSN